MLMHKICISYIYYLQIVSRKKNKALSSHENRDRWYLNSTKEWRPSASVHIPAGPLKVSNEDFFFSSRTSW